MYYTSCVVVTPQDDNDVDCYVWVIITTARLGVRLIHGGVAGHSSIMHTHHCNTDHPFSLLRIHLAVNLDKK